MKKYFKKLFSKGILFFFRLEENPIRQYAEEMKLKSDADRIAEDRIHVGNDIRMAYGKFQRTTKTTS